VKSASDDRATQGSEPIPAITIPPLPAFPMKSLLVIFFVVICAILSPPVSCTVGVRGEIVRGEATASLHVGMKIDGLFPLG
jgi:hypothetical protein